MRTLGRCFSRCFAGRSTTLSASAFSTRRAAIRSRCWSCHDGWRPRPLAGGFGLPGTTPLASRIESGFARQLEPLSVDTRRLLVLAAAEPIGDVPLLWRAAELLGIGPDAAGPAEAA